MSINHTLILSANKDHKINFIQMTDKCNRNIVDKEIESLRYETRAYRMLNSHDAEALLDDPKCGSFVGPVYLSAPYKYYESEIKKHAKLNSNILEIASGTGVHTAALLLTGASVTATDISENSLIFLFRRFSKYKSKLSIKVVDMESLEFPDESFDVVTSAGSLSYGSNKIVMTEIFRVLKPGGVFICVDSLNHNYIYRMNRLFQYFLGKRTYSTVQRMPTLETIEAYGALFSKTDVAYFGSLAWAAPFLRIIISDSTVAHLIDFVDRVVKVKKSAFKFVMVAYKGVALFSETGFPMHKIDH